MMRPIARWHGGKWRLAPWIISHLPPHRVYVEPYAGAASVLMRKPRSHTEVLNDMYGRLVNAFRVIRDHPEDLARLLRYTPYANDEYSACREKAEDAVEDARRLIVLGQQSRGSTGVTSEGKDSGWRRGLRPKGTNSAREWETLWRQVEAWADRLRCVYIENRDALDIIHQWDSPETTIYADPPYVSSTRTACRRAYGDYEMSDDDHVRLSEVLKFCKASVVLSGYRSELYDELYPGWKRVERTALADCGKSRLECLWLNPKAAEMGSLFQERMEAV